MKTAWWRHEHLFFCYISREKLSAPECSFSAKPCFALTLLPTSTPESWFEQFVMLSVFQQLFYDEELRVLKWAFLCGTHILSTCLVLTTVISYISWNNFLREGSWVRVAFAESGNTDTCRARKCDHSAILRFCCIKVYWSSCWWRNWHLCLWLHWVLTVWSNTYDGSVSLFNSQMKPYDWLYSQLINVSNLRLIHGYFLRLFHMKRALSKMCL